MTAWFMVVLRDLRYIFPPLAGIVVLDLAAMFAVHAEWMHVELAVWPGRVLMLAMGAHVVLLDPVRGGHAYWRTRPVSGASMAVGKTLTLGVVAFGMGLAMLGGALLAGVDAWPGVTLGLWEVFRAALWVMLGAALAALVESVRGFIGLAVAMLVAAAAILAALFVVGRHSEFVASILVRGAREHGRAVMLAGVLAMVFAFAAVARRYMWPHRCWTARALAWMACLSVLGHEGLRLLVR